MKHMSRKRLLTNDEIEYILSDIHPIQSIDTDVADMIYSKMIRLLRSKLEKSRVYLECIPEIKKEITSKYYKSQAQAGDSVGIIAAQSIGERQTQLALDSFHSTGITTLTVVSGMPRFNELINVTKNPKNIITYIYSNTNYYSISDIRNNLGIQIESVTFSKLILSTEECQYEKWYSTFFKHYPTDKERFDKHSKGIRYHINKDIMFMYKITVKDIVDKIIEQSDDDNIICVWTPDYVGIIDVYNYMIPSVHFLVKGVSGMSNVFYSKDLKSGIWHIESSGNNMKELLAHNDVDPTRTYSNHMWEIYETLGLEAVREFLVNEFMGVISTESYINLRHVQLLVDVMLYTGSISSISRYGVHRNQAGVLTMCSFEESLDQLMKAGIYGEKELIKGVSGAIICGKINPSGTGLCDVLFKPINERL